jgi:hypothetical protein
MGNSRGWWDSCTGCTNSEDGHLIGDYPIHPKHLVPVGGGCDECKGQGVVFHPFTKAMADDCRRMAMEK